MTNEAARRRWPGVTIELAENDLYYFDAEEAQRAVEFFPRYLMHYKGEHAGAPFELEPWESELIVKPLFGWRRKADGLRRFRSMYVEVPKKNGKSTLCAGLAIYLLFCDGEPGAEVYSAAADREQARIVFDTAKTMVELSPALAKRATVYMRSIIIPETFSSYKVLSADVKTKHGPNIHALVFDELHTQPNRELWDTLTKGIAARREPLILAITTAGVEEESICKEQHDQAAAVISGRQQKDSLLPVIFAANDKDDWQSPEVWKKVNPNIGKTVKMEYLADEAADAAAEPRKVNSFKRLHLNVWTRQAEQWIDIAAWDNCAAELELSDYVGRDCYMGFDLSQKADLTALALLFPRDLPDRAATELKVSRPAAEGGGLEYETMALNYGIDLFVFFWIPEDTMHRRGEEDGVNYDVWSRAEMVTPTPGEIVDLDLIMDSFLDDIAPHFNIMEIGFDMWAATQFATNLQKLGFPVVEVRQGVQSMSEPSKVFEALIKSGRLRHDGNLVLRWNAGNVAVKEDKKENIFPHKPSKTKRIDGIIAGIIGLNRYLNSAPEEHSAYEKSGVEFI